MTRDDIIRMAREAYISEYHLVVLEQGILRFANSVAAAEREKVIELVAMYGGSVDLEAAIRARGQE